MPFIFEELPRYRRHCESITLKFLLNKILFVFLQQLAEISEINFGKTGGKERNSTSLKKDLCQWK